MPSNDEVPSRRSSELFSESPVTHVVLDKEFTRRFVSGDTTPSVLNLVHFLSNGSATITDFDDGQESQRIHILGNGSTTVANNANIKRNPSVSFVLLANTIYTFEYRSGIWYESSGLPSTTPIVATSLTLPGSLRWLGRTSTAADPTTTELPTDKDLAIHKNTASGNVYLAYNDAGAIKKVQLV